MAELAPTIMTDTNRSPDIPDRGLRRMLTWVFVALILTVLLAVLVVELTLRSANLR